MEKIKIGNSDYSRKQMEQGDGSFTIGCSSEYFLNTIKQYENEGYTVKFETSFWRKIFGMGIYKVVAYR